MIQFTIGKLFVQFGGLRKRVGPLWIPDGLHIWWGYTRVRHLFWSGSG
jgi:hypothetical protein